MLIREALVGMEPKKKKKKNHTDPTRRLRGREGERLKADETNREGELGGGAERKGN